jgi:1-acyl-sn-glycerol-3-phosphate acyltransferase
MKRLIGRFVLWVSGWKQLSSPPDEPKYVAIAAPHTSNWDLVLLLAVAWVNRVKLSWMGKHTLFRGPLGWLLRRFGGIPIDRRSRHNVVEQMAEVFRQAKRLILAIPPEGTRKHTGHWKSGFYHIARLAQVPIIPGALDYARKEASAGPPILPGEDTLLGDMQRIRAFYAGKLGRFPELMAPIRLHEEEGEPAGKLTSSE